MIAPSVNRTIAFARFPGLIRDAVRGFQRLTGFTAVTTLGSASADTRTRSVPSPPVHPRSAQSCCENSSKSALRRGVAETSPVCCEHAGLPDAYLSTRAPLRGSAHRSRRRAARSGQVRFGREVPKERFRSLVGLLEALIARPCQDTSGLRSAGGDPHVAGLGGPAAQGRPNNWPTVDGVDPPQAEIGRPSIRPRPDPDQSGCELLERELCRHRISPWFRSPTPWARTRNIVAHLFVAAGRGANADLHHDASRAPRLRIASANEPDNRPDCRRFRFCPHGPVSAVIPPHHRRDGLRIPSDLRRWSIAVEQGKQSLG